MPLTLLKRKKSHDIDVYFAISCSGSGCGGQDLNLKESVLTAASRPPSCAKGYFTITNEELSGEAYC